MSVELTAYGYEKRWKHVHVDDYTGYRANMSDYHMHACYEISLILSGNVKVLLTDTVQSGEGVRLVLLRPMTPHCMIPEPTTLYRRCNLLLSPDLLADYQKDLQSFLPAFGENGAVLELDVETGHKLLTLMKEIEHEGALYRQRLLVLYFLSLAAEHALPKKAAALPAFLSEALRYIAKSFDQHIVASELAWQLGVGRTKLMLGFKQHIGMTLGEYITRTRLRHATDMLQQGNNEAEVARACGFTDAPNMIRCFKKAFGMPPRQYLTKIESVMP